MTLFIFIYLFINLRMYFTYNIIWFSNGQSGAKKVLCPGRELSSLCHWQQRTYTTRNIVLQISIPLSILDGIVNIQIIWSRIKPILGLIIRFPVQILALVERKSFGNSGSTTSKMHTRTTNTAVFELNCFIETTIYTVVNQTY